MLDFVELLDPSKISLYRHQFHKTTFSSLLKNFGHHFNRVKLEAELRAFYHAKEFENLFAHQILQLLSTTELFHTMPQIVKLCEHVLTVPSTSASVEHSFSALKCIKSYCHSSMGQSRLSELPLLSIEKTSFLIF